MKFSHWIKLKEEATGGISAPAATPAAPATAPTSGTNPEGTGPSDSSNDGSTKSTNIAIRPSVVGCGFCYPTCNCNKKRKKKRKRKGKK